MPNAKMKTTIRLFAPFDAHGHMNFMSGECARRPKSITLRRMRPINRNNAPRVVRSRRLSARL